MSALQIRKCEATSNYYAKIQKCGNAYISGGSVGKDGKPLDIGADIFERGLCLPSDNKMTAEEQDKVIEIVRNCFE